MSRAGVPLTDPVARAAMAAIIAEAIRWQLDMVSERESAVIAQFVGLNDGVPKTLEQISLTYGVTEQRIYQILQRGFSRLRNPNPTWSSFLHEDLLDDEGLPAGVLDHLRQGKQSDQAPLIHCDRHGWIDPDVTPPPRQWFLMCQPPKYCGMCPCPLSPRERGRAAHYCSNACRQAAHRWQRTRPRQIMTPARLSTAQRLRAEGATVEQIAEAIGVSSSTVGKHLRAALRAAK